MAKKSTVKVRLVPEEKTDSNIFTNISGPISNLFKHLLKTKETKTETKEEGTSGCKSNILEQFFIKFNKTKFDKDDDSIGRCIIEQKENKYENSLKCD